MPRYDPPGVHIFGRRWEFVITVTDEMGQKLDLTGATVTLALGGSVSRCYLRKQATVEDQDDLVGQALAVFLPAETAAFPRQPIEGRLYYQVDVTFDPTHIDTVVDGFVQVQKPLSCS